MPVAERRARKYAGTNITFEAYEVLRSASFARRTPAVHLLSGLILAHLGTPGTVAGPSRKRRPQLSA